MKYMFLGLNTKRSASLACLDSDGNQITYGELVEFAGEFARTVDGRALIFILSENAIGTVAAYTASLSSHIVPLLLSCDINRSLLFNLISIYKPGYLWIPERISGEFGYSVIFEKYSCLLLKTDHGNTNLHEDLSLLLTTSGSTGSPKLVRHSYNNVEANARNVASIFNLTDLDRPIASLPLHYTMGLSVVTSHLYAGSTILLTKHNLTDKSYWDFIRDQRATSFTGVPYSYEVLRKLRFTKMNLPDLSLISQGGGRLSDDLFKELAQFAQDTGRRFIATYGQTEGTARMAFLPHNLATGKTGSIGRAIPDGELYLIDDHGDEIKEAEALGEMVYKGPNVTLGYAYCVEDLSKGDENHGVLFTGDLARRDKDGCYFIVGRLSRFLKLYGSRISLDEIEQLVKTEFNIDCYCTGNDDKMDVYITEQDKKELVLNHIVDTTGIYHRAVRVIVIDEITRNEAGKIIMR